MARHCKFCGTPLDEDELERSEEIGFYVCEECLNHGFTLLQKAISTADESDG
ncbi:MAG: hypothetical protein ABEK12_01450 [Candidatus Nanohaloarchaea archaeon]